MFEPMKTEKPNWPLILAAFQIGFCGHATLARIDSGNTADIFFPAVITVLSLVTVGLESCRRPTP